MASGDVVLPLALYSLLSAVLSPNLARQLGTLSPADQLPIPSDMNGTVWFYWWLERAWSRGHPFLVSDATCAPAGELLGLNFPSRIDAWLALPFFAWFPLPTSLNLFVLALPVLNAWAGYLFLRTLTSRRLVALAAGSTIGFNAYSNAEVTAGRPVTALFIAAPLFVGAWYRAVGAEPAMRPRRPTAGPHPALWGVASGAAAALALHQYAPLLIGAGLIAVLILLTGQAGLRRVLVATSAAATTGALLGLSYVHEVVVLRTQTPRSIGPETLWRLSPTWNPSRWLEIATHATPPAGNPLPPGDGGAPWWSGVQTESLPWDALWTPGWSSDMRVAWVAPSLIACWVVLGLVGGRRGRGWLALAVLFWLVTLGPNLSSSTVVHDVQYIELGGQLIPMPTALLLTMVPGLASWFKPYRMFVYVLIAGAAAWVCGIERLASNQPGRRGVAVEWIGVALAGWALFATARAGGTEPRLFPWRVPTFLEDLASDRADYVIAEVPAGGGHAYGLHQAVHGKRRSEPLHDISMADLGSSPPECLATPLSAALWRVGDPRYSAAVADGLGPEAQHDAADSGVRYVFFYPEVWRDGPRGAGRSATLAIAQLDAALGEPVYTSQSLIAWTVAN